MDNHCGYFNRYFVSRGDNVVIRVWRLLSGSELQKAVIWGDGRGYSNAALSLPLIFLVEALATIHSSI